MADQGQCHLDEFLAAGFANACEYVRNNSELCDGGGYVHWTELIFCTAAPGQRLLIGLGAVLFFALLFVQLSTTADAFFCRNIATIVDIHRISPNIAGITLMAFGNGAPDIFSSIASVISTKQPRADLAISGLLGGGIFVTTCVIGVIAFTRPFQMVRRPIIRDILFYLTALALLVVVAGQRGQMRLWCPLAFLSLYCAYAICVICSNLFRQKLRDEQRRHSMRRVISHFSGLVPPKRSAKVAPLPNGLFTVQMPQNLQEGNKTVANLAQKSVCNLATLQVAIAGIPFSDTAKSGAMEGKERKFSADDYLEAGKFFPREQLYESESAADEKQFEESVKEKEANRLSSSEFHLSGAASPAPLATVNSSPFRTLLPLNLAKWHNSAWNTRLYMLLKTLPLLLLNYTVPCAAKPWSKMLSVVHVFMAPLVFCAAFGGFSAPLQFLPATAVGQLAVVTSIFCSILTCLFTKCDREPACYKRCAAYAGFCLSIAWIYATAAEVMNVVLLFGNLSGIPYPILGVTAIAWCNSIGDLTADISVARQGMARMAFSAAIGAPLFNLMVGFGCTFLIAQIQGKIVTISIEPVVSVQFAFLALSLLSTLFLLLIQRFYVSQVHGIVLLCTYALFLAMAILASAHQFDSIL